MANRLIETLLNPGKRNKKKSFIRSLIAGSMYKVSDISADNSIATIKSKIDTMRALAKDSQISTALAYYATDSTTTNTAGQIIWATSDMKGLANIINELFKRWDVNSYARDHILELATIGNLYIPTTEMYRDKAQPIRKQGVALDNNTIPDNDFDIVPSHKIPPEDIIHVWKDGKPVGYIYQPEENSRDITNYPESSIIHFSLGGLLGEYTIDAIDKTGETSTYDIMFAEPLMTNAVAPTQTLGLLEDALLLSSLLRSVKFVNVDCSGSEEEEIDGILQDVKDCIEQQFSLNTSNGDAQSFINPQSPNNLVYLPKVNGSDPISITDLNMSDATESDNKLLNYYQDKKLSVLGVPKEALNFSSNEGLGGAGSVMSQRSALYANILNRLENAYIAGWTKALNTYFQVRNLSGYIGNFQLHMNPIITPQSTVQSERRDSAIGQAGQLVQLLKDAGITDSDTYTSALSEILTEVFPQMGSDASNWRIDVSDNEGGGSSEF